MAKYKINKVKLTDEQKRERAEFYNEYNAGFMPPVDIEEFIKCDIYDESVTFKCKKCGFENEIELDNVLEFETNKDGLPEIYCPKCNKGTMLPKDIIK